ncbi:MAG: hypothetical protein JO108_19400 [Acidobacteriaceae bacterium]|nr:hypothetical protein [Acidobacteriaceae bacterium]
MLFHPALLFRNALPWRASGWLPTAAFLGLSIGPSAAQELGPLAPETNVVAPVTSSRAAQELRAEEQQRILGVVPAFNISNFRDAAPLNPEQKFQLAIKSAFDPFSFVAAGLSAGLGQWQKAPAGYGYGLSGYAKRVQASYLDSLNGTMLGNAVFPVLLHQDPRYFRQGTGSFGSRLRHAALSTLRCRDDNGTADWNYSNLLGNVVTGALANTYYAKSDRGINLVFGRALTVTAEGALGAVFEEFWPDLSRKFLAHHKKGRD